MFSPRKLTLALGLLVMSAVGAQAQNPCSTLERSAAKATNLDKWSISADLGLLPFLGDIHKSEGIFPSTSPKNEVNFGLGLRVQRYIVPVFALQGQALFGTLSGAKVQDNNYFKTPFQYYGMNLVFNLSNLSLLRKLELRRWTVYMSFGGGLFSYKPELRYLDGPNAGEIIPHNPSGETSYSSGLLLAPDDQGKRLNDFAAAYGLGLKYRINDRWDLGAELQYFSVSNDKVDGYREFDNDDFGFWNVSLHYKFGKKRMATEWVNPLDLLGSEIDSIRMTMCQMSSDDDNDGVANYFDKDNNSPNGAKVYGNGTTVDTDGDGVADAIDADPYSTKGAKVDSRGVEMDDDGDGVPNARDLEPRTASGAMVNFQGKAIKAEGGSEIAWLPSVYFNTNSAQVQYKYYDNVATVARMMKSNESIKVRVIGNADSRGNTRLNQKLSLRRAEAIKDMLVKTYGISASRLTVDHKGSESPIGSELSTNRRVDFEVSK